MTVQFCDDCGDLLPVAPRRDVECECCGKTAQNKLLSHVSVSSTDKFPSDLRNKRTINMPKKVSSQDTWSKVDVKCRECDSQEVRYTALQLRGADEGTTMFYACPRCSARWNEDN